CVRVHESFSDGRLTDPKTFGSNRRVPMIRPVAEALAREGTRDLWVGDEDLVFAHPHKGTHLFASAVIVRYKQALERAELRRDTRFHDLRHTFGTQMAAGGRPLREIQAWMGHANIQTTEVYAQYAPDPSGGVDLAEKAYEAVTRRDNCQMTDTPSVRVA
ncbi:MAG: site-specific integrase, partial [Actinomycetota bacterium]|nr:site-specific integrase [Actinomycetota bacterium]